MQVINIPTMKAMIHQIGVKKRRPLMFWGPSGVGKSEGIQQAALEASGILVDIRASQYESVDFRGIPDIQLGSTVWNMPATMPFKGNPKFDEDGPTIFLFLDELNSAEPSVAAVMYQLINDRCIGEHQLMENVVIIAAGNRESDRGVTNKFPAPLANRMTHAELVADVKAWSAWASKAGVSPTLIGFLNFREGLLHTFDPNKPEKVFATPRTWSFVAEDFADTSLSDDVRIAAMSGSVGEGPAIELQGFADIMSELRPIEDIIADPMGIPLPDEARLDIQWAMATHVAGNMTKANAGPLHMFLDRLAPEMVVMAWTLAIQRDDSVTDSDAFLTGYAPKYRSIFSS